MEVTVILPPVQPPRPSTPDKTTFPDVVLAPETDTLNGKIQPVLPVPPPVTLRLDWVVVLGPLGRAMVTSP
jgi:hypothetical protein